MAQSITPALQRAYQKKSSENSKQIKNASFSNLTPLYLERDCKTKLQLLKSDTSNTNQINDKKHLERLLKIAKQQKKFFKEINQATQGTLFNYAD